MGKLALLIPNNAINDRKVRQIGIRETVSILVILSALLKDTKKALKRKLTQKGMFIF